MQIIINLYINIIHALSVQLYDETYTTSITTSHKNQNISKGMIMNTDEKNEKARTFIQAAGPSSILPAYKFQISDYIRQISLFYYYLHLYNTGKPH